MNLLNYGRSWQVFENVPSHVQQQYANKTLSWCSADSKEEFRNNLKNSHQHKLLMLNGWIDRDITYSFNSYGFRSREIDITNPGFAVLGCSFTMGIGLPLDEIWPVQLSKEISIPVDNFSVFGASNGLMFRMAHYWLPIVNPKFVILQTTFKERFEIINQYNESTVMSPSFHQTATTQEVFKNWWYTDANSIADQQRNELAIRYICHSLAIPIIVIDIEDFRNPVLGLSRELTHPGPQNHHGIRTQLGKQLTTMDIL